MFKEKTRARYVMVPEDDPQWVRFWAAYPRRDSKKEARKAWAQMNPPEELVDRMLVALAWQAPVNRWDADKRGFAPYPASWLRGERWDDERPPATAGNNGSRRPAWAQEQR